MLSSDRRIRIVAALLVTAGLVAAGLAIFADELGLTAEQAQGFGWKQITLLAVGGAVAAIGALLFARPRIVSSPEHRERVRGYLRAMSERNALFAAALFVVIGLGLCALALFAVGPAGLQGKSQSWVSAGEDVGGILGWKQLALLLVGGLLFAVAIGLLARLQTVSTLIDLEQTDSVDRKVRNVAAFILRTVMAHWSPILALSALGFSAWIAFHYAGQPIVELEAYRQTLTALTAHWMIEEGWQLPYQTPAWGYPWAAPIEFPIYQSLVVLITSVGHLSLEPVGRLVGYSFLIACAWPAFLIRKRLSLPPEAAWLFCALLWSSPLYLFWGRTFMIDTAAVFFTLAAIPYLLDLRGTQPPWRSAVLGSWWATLAMLQRSITAGPVLLVLGIVLVAPSVRTWRHSVPSRRLACLILALGPALIIGVAWTLYADSIARQNDIATGAVSLGFRASEAYLGTFGQRFDPGTLKEIFWDRILEQNAAGFLGAALILGGLLSGQRSLRRLIAVCLFLTAFPIFLFFGISLFLEYYQVSSVFFLIAAVSLSCVIWIPSVISWRGAVPIVASLLVAANVYNFWVGYGEVVRTHLDATQHITLAVGDVIDRYTPEDSGIIVFGLGEVAADSSSPEVAYLSERKGVTVPGWAEEEVIDDPASYLGGKELGAIAFCSTSHRERYNRMIAQSADSSEPHLFDIRGCHVWLPDTQAVVLPDGARIKPTHFLN